MSRQKQKVNKPGRRLVALPIAIIIAAVMVYFYKDAVSAPETDFDSIDTIDGLTQVGKGIMANISDISSSNMTLVISGDKASLIDTGDSNDEAQKIKDYLDKNGIVLNSIILTHMHKDHTANLSMFETGSIKLYKPSDLEEGQVITLESKHLKILKTDGHTPRNTHVSVEVVEDNVLVAGDVVITDGLPAVGGSYKDLINALKRVDSKGYSIIIPRHGAIMDSREATAKNLEYIENASKKIEELIKSGGALPQIEDISIGDCISDVVSQGTELLRQVHRFNLTNIYQQVIAESGK